MCSEIEESIRKDLYSLKTTLTAINRRLTSIEKQLKRLVDATACLTDDTFLTNPVVKPAETKRTESEVERFLSYWMKYLPLVVPPSSREKARVKACLKRNSIEDVLKAVDAFVVRRLSDPQALPAGLEDFFEYMKGADSSNRVLNTDASNPPDWIVNKYPHIAYKIKKGYFPDDIKLAVPQDDITERFLSLFPDDAVASSISAAVCTVAEHCGVPPQTVAARVLSAAKNLLTDSDVQTVISWRSDRYLNLRILGLVYDCLVFGTLGCPSSIRDRINIVASPSLVGPDDFSTLLQQSRCSFDAGGLSLIRKKLLRKAIAGRENGRERDQS